AGGAAGDGAPAALVPAERVRLRVLGAADDRAAVGGGRAAPGPAAAVRAGRAGPRLPPPAAGAAGPARLGRGVRRARPCPPRVPAAPAAGPAGGGAAPRRRVDRRAAGAGRVV